MDAVRWEHIQEIFHKALELPASERPAFLDSACADDPELRSEISAMLREDSASASVLDDGLPAFAFRALSGQFDAGLCQEFGPYRLLRVLGEGGMGVVWLAERSDAGNLVAIKFLPHAGLSPARRERFAREIKTLAKLKHAYVARLYDAGSLPDGTPWFVMEYVEGVPFTEFCRSEERSIEALLRLFRTICEAVQYAHSQEIIHRDLKPSNILVQPDGTPRLLDFGIAKELQSLTDHSQQTRAGLRFFSPDYAAPEWVSEGSVGFYTDVYSLGVMLYEMLAGQLPFPAGNVRVELPGNPSDDGRRRFKQLGRSAWTDLDVLCLKSMHKDPAGRYQSVEALMRDIDHYIAGEPLEARPDTLRYRAAKFVRRNWQGVGASALAVLLIGGLIIFFTARLAAERDHANRETAIANSMNRFLSDDLLARSDPFQSGKAQESFVDVVSRSATQIDVKFAREPVVAARLHQILGKAFDNRSEYGPAGVEYQRAHDLFVLGEGRDSQDAILMNLQLADMEAMHNAPGSLALATRLLHEAEKAMGRISHPRADLETSILSTRGIVALVGNDARSASEAFSAALQRGGAVESSKAAERFSIRELLAVAYIHLGDGARAEPLCRESVATATSSKGPASPAALRARVYLAQSLLIQRKFAAAVQEVNDFYPTLVRVLGIKHLVTLTALGTRAAAEGSLEMWDDAIRDDLAAYGFYSSQPGPPSVNALGFLSDAGLSQCRAGRYQAGLVNARKAFLESKRVFGERAGLTGGCSYALAICQIEGNHLEEASRLLEDIDVKAATEMSGDTSFGAGVALARAQIAMRHGDQTAANRYLKAAAPAFDRSDADLWQKHSFQTLRRALSSHMPAPK